MIAMTQALLCEYLRDFPDTFLDSLGQAAKQFYQYFLAQVHLQ